VENERTSTIMQDVIFTNAKSEAETNIAKFIFLWLQKKN
jgi:hypothetical protein